MCNEVLEALFPTMTSYICHSLFIVKLTASTFIFLLMFAIVLSVKVRVITWSYKW